MQGPLYPNGADPRQGTAATQTRIEEARSSTHFAPTRESWRTPHEAERVSRPHADKEEGALRDWHQDDRPRLKAYNLRSRRCNDLP